MSQPPPPGQRFDELGSLLQAYAQTGFTFADTAETPGPGLASYLRIAARDPERAATALRQIDDLLSVGLFSEETADEVENLPHIRPPMGASVEDCLRIVRGHLYQLLQDPSRVPYVNPQNSWEWNERFPALSQLLGAYFHRDFSYIYDSRDEALDEYVSEALPEDRAQAVQEMGELLAMASSDQELDTATEALGLDLLPPQGMSLRQWLEMICRRVASA
ncbi:contact-dependent growth inhibition system immunity protein [Streptomyces sp. NBC_00201]|uniref:contact-dependent growth inhibition system immunity protein n=1 Tax=unclassified Streptomyces TaxID=2593676 RepID=UPI00225A698D|nr:MULTISPECIES: contact-dependent growth inhibition system immunity protein [unclassified Streptomyces]MCX5060178.1 contact-dependent growth inhibition system immunity protein [Streptomyces sp. NBC_00452]MCX5252043.1 contact-dependent growth inhibition system immunity protein [Streptomyces sp. NBC_00201]